MNRHPSLLISIPAVFAAMAVATALVPGAAGRQEPVQVDLARAALTLEDVGPDYTVDEERSAGATTTGRVVSYQVTFTQTPAQALRMTGPMLVMSGLFTVPGERIPPGTVDSAMAGALASIQNSPTATLVDTADAVEGPSLGDASKWLAVRGAVEGIPISMDGVAFQVGDVVAFVITAGIGDRGTQDDAARFARIVAARLGWAPESATPVATETSAASTPTVVPPSPSATSTPAATRTVTSVPSGTPAAGTPAGTPRPTTPTPRLGM